MCTCICSFAIPRQLYLFMSLFARFFIAISFLCFSSLFYFFNVICNIFTCLQFLWCFCFHKDFSYPTPFHLVNEFYSQSIKCIEYSLKYTFAMYVNSHLIIIILNKLGTHTRYAAKYQPNHKPWWIKCTGRNGEREKIEASHIFVLGNIQ